MSTSPPSLDAGRQRESRQRMSQERSKSVGRLPRHLLAVAAGLLTAEAFPRFGSHLLPGLCAAGPAAAASAASFGAPLSSPRSCGSRHHGRSYPGGFALIHPVTCAPISSSPSLLVTFMGRKKGATGRLSDIIDLAADDPARKSESVSKKKAANNSTPKGKPSTTAPNAKTGISPLLAQWASAKEKSSPADSVPIRGDAVDGGPDADAPSPSLSVSTAPKSPRRQKQQEQRDGDRERLERVRDLVDRMEAMLSGDDNSPASSFNVAGILALLEQLLELSAGPTARGGATISSQLRQLVAGSRNHHYRLAWAGSDRAICHLGTGLHKVKLARLQEIFLTLGPRSRVQMYEVIRVLGPFPNVKNTLVGTCAVIGKQGRTSAIRTRGIADGDGGRGEAAVQPWTITWESLVDGTGKELIAGTKPRNVDLRVLFCDEAFLVCAAVLNGENDRSTPLLHDNGEDLLVFVREGSMEDKLDALRVI